MTCCRRGTVVLHVCLRAFSEAVQCVLYSLKGVMADTRRTGVYAIFDLISGSRGFLSVFYIEV